MTGIWTLLTALSKLSQTWVKPSSITPVKPMSSNVKRISLRLGNRVSIHQWGILDSSCWTTRECQQNIIGFKLLISTSVPHLQTTSNYSSQKEIYFLKSVTVSVPWGHDRWRPCLGADLVETTAVETDQWFPRLGVDWQVVSWWFGGGGGGLLSVPPPFVTLNEVSPLGSKGGHCFQVQE